MAEGIITLEHLELQLINYTKEDLRKKMEIAANVLKKCELGEYPKMKTVVQRTSYLTGVSTYTVGQIAKMTQKSKKFGHWIDEEIRKIHGYNFAYLSLRNYLIETYTKRFEIPTNLKYINAGEGYKQYCTSLPLPETKSSIIVEKPETVLERHRFLYTKMLYREADRHIVYIGKITLQAFKGNFSYKQDKDFKNCFIIAVSPKIGYLDYIYCATNKLKQNILTNWILEKIEHQLPRESVVIFHENVVGLIPEFINTHSSKEQMVNWLKSKKIPHDPTLHRADLYKLINKDNGRDLAPAEDFLRAHGHITMVKRKCNLDNNYFDSFWDLLIHNLNAKKLSNHMPLRLHSYTDVITQTANEIVLNTPLDYWKGLDDALFEKERQIYKEDLEMEHIIDQLMVMAKNKDLVDDERPRKLDEYSKQLAEEHFFLNADLIDILRQMTNIQGPNKTNLGN